nr:PREDICTED: protocadherin alpha-C2-like [Lepisosteus oculatus]
MEFHGVIFVLSMACSVASSKMRYSVPEEMEKGSVIANLAKDIGVDVDSLMKPELRIALGPGKQFLDVNKENGNLYVVEKIDREELCGSKTNCLLNLEVIIENTLKIYAVEVEITDINDNSPRFPINRIELNISESALPGERFSLKKAVDPDIGVNTVREYKLTKNDHFDIEVQTWSDGSTFADLLLKKSLDREDQAFHNLILTAIDGGDPVQSGTASIIVRVLDANDNAPRFDQQTYNVSITENALLGTLVLKLNATDLDEGSNAEIVYSFGRFTSEKVQDAFTLDSKTGEIKVKGILDFEEYNYYELYVQANDRTPNAMVGHCKVVIQVTDTNDNQPGIIITSFNSPVAENIPVGTVIAVFGVTDSDSGENGKVDCRISETRTFKLHQSLENYYAMVTSEPLDRETTPDYNITITVRDRGVPPLSTSKTLSLELLDVNDNPPIFKKRLYSIHVMENNMPGDLLTSIVAFDPDLNENRQITYSVVENAGVNVSVSQFFSLNPENGNIYALQSLDYETHKEFQFFVKAKDSGTPPLSSNVTVHIIVLDQNDNSPVIVSPCWIIGSWQL